MSFESEMISAIQSQEYHKLVEALAEIYEQQLGLPPDAAGTLSGVGVSHMLQLAYHDPEIELEPFMREVGNRLVLLRNDQEPFEQQYGKRAKKLGRKMLKAIAQEQAVMSEFWNMVKWHIHFEELVPHKTAEPRNE
jgi:hypothetical protein